MLFGRVKQHFRGRAKRRDAAHALYTAAVQQARERVFYETFGVPDSLDGRFDLIVLHVVLLLRRVRQAGEAGRQLSQTVFDVMFDDMDQSLREMGVGDLGVGKRVKQMAQAFFGRAEAYEAALDRETEAERHTAIEAALRRNIYGKVDAPEAAPSTLARYVVAVNAALDAQAGGDIVNGRVRYPAPPQPVGPGAPHDEPDAERRARA